MSTPEVNHSEKVIETARAAWGDQYTQAIFGTVINSIHRANEAYHPINPVDRLKINIADLPLARKGVPTARLIGLHDKWSGFSLLMDANDPQAVLDEAEVTVFHETARVHLFQQRIRRGYYNDNTELDVLGGVIESGMVISSVEEHLGKDAFDLDRYLSYDVEKKAVHKYIRQFIDLGERDSGMAESHDILMGSPDFPRPGYKVGHAIVRSAMEEYDMPVDVMLTHGPEFFADYARWMVRPKKKTKN